MAWKRKIAILVCTTALPIAAGAADWHPSQRITFATHASAGTGVDVFMREVAEIWRKRQLVAQPAIVENVTGGSGERARQYVVTQHSGDPHLLFGYTPALINTAILIKSKVTVKSYTHIAALAVEPLVLYVNAQSAYQSVKDLVAAAREKPKGIMQGGGAFGNVPSLMAKMLADEAKVNFGYVGFKGGGEAVIALLGNHIQFIMEQPSEVSALVKQGKLRPLASSQKLEMYPNLPTFSSLGYRFKPLVQFRAIVAPPGISADVVDFYVQALQRARQTPEWKQYVARNALQEIWLERKELTAFLEEQEAQYHRLNKDIGLLK